MKFIKLDLALISFLAALALAHPSTADDASPAPDAGAFPALGEELIDPTESQQIDFIVKATLDRLRIQFPPESNPVLRDAHPKTHLLVRAEFIVLDNLPDTYRYGVFSEPQTYKAIVRLSAGGIQVQSDAVPQANGMAIKLLGVKGEKILADQKDAETQDFVMINNFPSFFVRNLADYQAAHEALGVQDPAAGVAAFFNDHPEELAAVVAMRGSVPLSSPFQARYWSQTPFKLGPHAMKFSVRPISKIVPVTHDAAAPDFLREVGIRQVGEQDIYLEFLVQLQTDPKAMPVEDSLVVWDEARSPFQRVALIRIPQQRIDVELNQKIAENLSFNPWHSLPDLRPIGAINRARKAIYEALSKFRHERNRMSRKEPVELPF